MGELRGTYDNRSLLHDLESRLVRVAGKSFVHHAAPPVLQASENSKVYNPESHHTKEDFASRRPRTGHERNLVFLMTEQRGLLDSLPLSVRSEG